LRFDSASKRESMGLFDGSLLGNAGINIATFALGRDCPGGSAIALVEVDRPIPDSVLADIEKLPRGPVFRDGPGRSGFLQGSPDRCRRARVSGAVRAGSPTSFFYANAQRAP
jgi:hypothetical protein